MTTDSKIQNIISNARTFLNSKFVPAGDDEEIQFKELEIPLSRFLEANKVEVSVPLFFELFSLKEDEDGIKETTFNHSTLESLNKKQIDYCDRTLIKLMKGFSLKPSTTKKEYINENKGRDYAHSANPRKEYVYGEFHDTQYRDEEIYTEIIRLTMYLEKSIEWVNWRMSAQDQNVLDKINFIYSNSELLEALVLSTSNWIDHRIIGFFKEIVKVVTFTKTTRVPRSLQLDTHFLTYLHKNEKLTKESVIDIKLDFSRMMDFIKTEPVNKKRDKSEDTENNFLKYMVLSNMMKNSSDDEKDADETPVLRL